MAKLCFTTHIQASNTLHHSETHMFTIYIQKVFTLLYLTSFYIPMQYLLNLQIHAIIFLQMIQTLQTLWFLTMIMKNNII